MPAPARLLDDVDSYARNHLIDTDTDPNQKYYGVFVWGRIRQEIVREAITPGVAPPTAPTRLYYVWESILQESNGMVNVNLLLNRASAWMDLDSYLPYEGRAVVRNKSARAVTVRMPTGSIVIVRVRGLKGALRPAWIGQRLFLDHLLAGDGITIEFPVIEVIEKHRIAGGETIAARSSVFSPQALRMALLWRGLTGKTYGTHADYAATQCLASNLNIRCRVWRKCAAVSRRCINANSTAS